MKIRNLKIKRTREVDMSSEGISIRLEELDQLYKLSQSLLTARPIETAKESKPSEKK